MSITNYIKEIGRGKEGARSLSREQAQDLMSQVLDGQVSDLELGAFAMAMRIKGESVDELAGFLQATAARCLPIACDRTLVVLPSYNGARKLPNLTPLLALMLAQEGVPVLVHGMPEDPGRVTTADIFQVLGLPLARDADDVAQAWRRREPVFIRTDALCPPLARLLDARWTIGLRNSGHTVAKLLDPCAAGQALRVVNYTHPEYGTMLTDFLQRTTANALLMRGTEGEPVADPRRLPRMDLFIDGQPRTELSLSAHDGVLRELPVLPRTCDAATTALYIQSVISGEKPAPAPLTQQVACLLDGLAALERAHPKEKTA
ncbi:MULTISPECIES: DNA-binding protein YbiB [unclassified Rhizobacter]|uniref:DNA-binding protein YbiB n=1 Tax=unclassified Rhizobacter TaxID=2640088 RepID=UPI0006FA139B|nr:MULTISPECIES: DNA-binding protein YbiB [unclassified Rhizobacter]KQU64515.1 glycosyl transferase [Rhizobacter sp. Root29]KQW11570.1 glycosyl transferase [Rhizobacter sp. Root1238]KRB19826.1 glycosyl transferase [Rhizobacter sp. Root16D2]